VRGNDAELLLSSLVNPGIPIPQSIVRLTGISERMVRHAPDFETILPRILETLEGGIFVAHNARFRLLLLEDRRRTGGRGGASRCRTCAPSS
jgi:DNA polymerase III epsilon subunit-like protein